MLVKICGLRDPETAIAAAGGGADMLGFVFYPNSPRALSPESAEEIVTEVKQSLYDKGLEAPKFVGLFVDAGEQLLAETAPFLTHFQFHGAETPERVEALGTEFGMESIKALPISVASDLNVASEFSEAADMLLFDARPPKGAERPGGHGVIFDWSILRGYVAETPYLVAGGLNSGNVAAAIAAQQNAAAFSGVDVSSGVESALGTKDVDLIKAFISKVKSAS